MTALPDMTFYQVDVRGRSMFKCDVCGAVAQGDRVQYAPGVLVEYSGRQLGEMLAELRGSARHMPVGWGSYHPDIHKCPNCNKEN